MKDVVSKRVIKIPPSGIRKFFELTLSMDDVISLGVGEPDFVTPWHIREAAMYSLERGYTMYTSNWGLQELRDEISKALNRDYKVHYDPTNEILITIGVSEAFDLALRAILNPGDEVIIPEPCFVSYGPMTYLAGGKPKPVVTTVENEFKVTPEQIEEQVTKKTKAIILSYPNNPTGGVMTKKDMEAVADVVEEKDLIVISDEIYDHLTYNGKHTCFSSLNGMRDKTIYLNGFSKAYAMTGWRVGYACANPEITEAMFKIHQYSMMCASIMGQVAALEALRHGKKEMRGMVSEYNQRRKFIVKRLNDIGLACFEPRGAFYAFPSIQSTGLTSEEFAEGLLKEENVAVVPGNAFGKSGGGFVRCAYAASTEDISEAMDRVKRFVERL